LQYSDKENQKVAIFRHIGFMKKLYIFGFELISQLNNHFGPSKVRATSEATEVDHYFRYYLFGPSEVRATSGAT
jgi:hypothetical protein